MLSFKFNAKNVAQFKQNNIHKIDVRYFIHHHIFRKIFEHLRYIYLHINCFLIIYE